jgi:hypothetical protein
VYVKDTFIGELNAPPYNFEIPARTLSPGIHTIKVTALTKKGKKAEAFRKVNILNETFESDDYVAFRNGKIPAQWSAFGWTINSPGGYNDFYYVSTNEKVNSISTNKTCNKIVFYLKGWGKINFYINSGVYKEIEVGSHADPTYGFDQDWTRYEFTFPLGLHNFSWKNDEYYYISSKAVGLDEIRFYTQ